MSSVDWTELGYTDGYEAGVADASPQRMVREFHEATGLAVNAEDTCELREFRADLLDEEFGELFADLVELTDEDGDVVSYPTDDLGAIAKELADCIYVLFGTAVSLGINLDEALRRVHESNMSKLGDDGKPLRRADGKILKGPNYQPPDMTGVVFNSEERSE